MEELRGLLAEVSDESILHHTCHYFLSAHTLEYTNDFAYWVAWQLGEKSLSEHLSNIDPYDFSDIEDLRHELLGVLDKRLDAHPQPRDATSGGEFHFSEAITLVFPLHVKAQNLAEFLIALRYIDRNSIFYHFYEARMRLKGQADDFSKWCAGLPGQEEVAEKIQSIDPFMHTLEGIRERIIETVEEQVRRSMEELLT